MHDHPLINAYPKLTKMTASLLSLRQENEGPVAPFPQACVQGFVDPSNASDGLGQDPEADDQNFQLQILGHPGFSFSDDAHCAAGNSSADL